MIAALIAGGLGFGLAPSFIVTGGLAFGTSSIKPDPILNTRYIAGPTLLQTTPESAGTGSPAYQPYTVFIGGVDRTGYVRVGAPVGPGIALNKQINSRDTASFTTLDASAGTYAPTAGQSVLIYERDLLIYRGFVDRTTQHSPRTPAGAHPQLDTSVNCVDFGIICDRRIVGRYYTEMMGGLLGIIATNIISDFMSDTGITLIWTFTAFQLIGDITFNYVTVTEAFNTLARAANADWRIDEHGNLRFFTATDGYTAAPADFTESSGNWIDVRVTKTKVRFANRVIAKSSRNLGAIWTDEALFGPFGFVQTQYAMTSKPIVTLDDVDQIVLTDAEVRTGAYFDFYYFPGGLGVFHNRYPYSSTGVVKVKYISPLPYVAIAEDAGSIAADGLQEAVIEAGDIDNKDNLQAIAAAALARGVELAQDVEITTRSSGYSPGQRVSINITRPAINDNFLIESVASREISQHWFEHAIKCTNHQFQRPSASNRYIGDIIARTRTPIDRIIERIQFTVAETIEGITNPGLTNGTKQAIKRAQKKGIVGWITLHFKSVDDGIMTTGPIVMDVFQNGTSIFGDLKLILPAGAAEIKEIRFREDPLLIAEGDIFTYEVVAEDPVATDGTLELVVFG